MAEIPSWVTPPPEGVPVTMALETLTNPVTGETFTAPSGGYTINVSASDASTDTTTDTTSTPSTVSTGGELAVGASNPDFDLEGKAAYTAPETEGQQQIISTTPQSTSEVNVVDYMGVQAGQPTLQPETQLAPQIEKQEVQEGEIQQYTGLSEEAPTADAYVADVATTEMPEMAETALGEATLAETLDKPEVSTVEAATSIEKVSEEADKLQAAQLELGEVDPRATVQGQLAMLQEQFAEGETPVWAQGAMRTATALMAQRGMGASTIAAESITNALMQSALPIAQQDSSFYQTVTMQNLANEQQVALEKFNSRVTAIFNDTAAENAARNINAASENEMAQFFTSLAQNVELANTETVNAMEQFNVTAKNQAEQFATEMQVSVDQFSAEQINAMSQFNAEQMTNVSKFNATMKDQREQFQVANQVAIDASNVQWRRDVNTANTSAINAAIQQDVQNLLGIQQSALNNIWDHYDTILDMAFKSEESALDRAVNVAISTISASVQAEIQKSKENTDLISDIFDSATSILVSESGSSIIGNILG